MSGISRRHFLAGLGGAATAATLRPFTAAAFARRPAAGDGPFKVSVLTDEISQDFAHACEIAAKEFGLRYVELRAMHNKNVMSWDDKDVADARAVLAKHQLQVSEIASPIFKTDWPGAPKSKFSPAKPDFGADFTDKQQDDLIDRACELAKTFETPYVRIFDFWRLEDQAPYRAAIDERVRKAAARAAARGITLTLENEPSCNTATGGEAARLLNAVNERGLMLNWDPGNAASRGEAAYPDGYAGLPKNRIGHVHCKDVVKKDGGGTAWAPMGKGIIDWAGQFRALAKDGYRGAVSLETHWHGGGTPEESSRQSMAGMKQLLAQVGS